MAYSPITAPATVRGLPGFDSATFSDFGAKGDGVTDDLTALQEAVASGKNLWADGSKTYLTSGPLNLVNGQKIYWNGATLKNVNQISDTTATAITGATTQITVGNGALWKVGQSFTVYDGVNFDAQPHPITAINGNVLTFSTAFTQNFPSGGTVYLTYYNFGTNDNNAIQDLILDGNKSNWTFYRWQVTGGISMHGTNSLIWNPRLSNIPGEGAVVFGTDNAIYRMKGDSFNGNGIHFSGATRPNVDGITLKNMNLDTAVGHANGGVIWSNGIVDARVHNIYVENALTAIGSIDSFDNSDLTVSKVIGRNCTQAGVSLAVSSGYSAPCRISLSDMKMYGCQIGYNLVSDVSFALSISSSTNASPIAITTSVNHQMADGQPVLIWGHTTNTAANGTYYAKATGNAANVVTLYQDELLTVPVPGNGVGGATGNILAQIANVTMNNCHAYDSVAQSVSLSNVRDLSGSGNMFVAKGGSGATVNVLISDCQNVTLNAAIRGGTYGVYAQSPNGNQSNVVINGTVISSQYNAGASLPTDNMKNTALVGSMISSDPTAISTYDGVVLGRGAGYVASGVYIPSNVAAAHSGVNMGNGSIAIADMVWTPSISYPTIRTAGGSTANIAVANAISSSPSDGNAAASSNLFGLNYDPFNFSMNAIAPTGVDSANTSVILGISGPTSSPGLRLLPKNSGTVKLSKHLQGETNLSASAVGANAGSGATVSVTAGGDNYGVITINLGTGATIGQLATITTQFGWSTTPAMLLTPLDVNGPAIGAWSSYDTGSVFSVRCANLPLSSTTYKLD